MAPSESADTRMQYNTDQGTWKYVDTEAWGHTHNMQHAACNKPCKKHASCHAACHATCHCDIPHRDMDVPAKVCGIELKAATELLLHQRYHIIPGPHHT